MIIRVLCMLYVVYGVKWDFKVRNPFLAHEHDLAHVQHARAYLCALWLSKP